MVLPFPHVILKDVMHITPAMLESAGELLDEAAAYKKKLAAG